MELPRSEKNAEAKQFSLDEAEVSVFGDHKVIRFLVSGEPFDLETNLLDEWSSCAWYSSALFSISAKKFASDGVPVVQFSRDIRAFRILKSYVETGELIIPKDQIDRDLLKIEALFYNFPEVVQQLATLSAIKSQPKEKKIEFTFGEVSVKEGSVIPDLRKLLGSHKITVSTLTALSESGTAQHVTALGSSSPPAELTSEDQKLIAEERVVRAIFGRDEDATKKAVTIDLFEREGRLAKQISAQRVAAETKYPLIFHPKSKERAIPMPLVESFARFKEQFDALTFDLFRDLHELKLPIVIAGGAVLTALHAAVPRARVGPSDLLMPEFSTSEGLQVVAEVVSLNTGRFAPERIWRDEASAYRKQRRSDKIQWRKAPVIRERYELCANMNALWFEKGKIVPFPPEEVRARIPPRNLRKAGYKYAVGGVLDESEAESKDESKDETKDEPKSESKDEPKDESKDEPKSEPKSESKDEPKDESKDEPKIEPKNEPKSETTNSRVVKNLRAMYRGDIDIFLTTRDETEAFNTIVAIDKLLREKAFPGASMRIFRTDYSTTFQLPHPYRNVQVIHRLYFSPEHVINGFDVDCCALAYDGKRMIAMPRAVRALMHRFNLVDPSRQSTTYETRMLKYLLRGFDIALPAADLGQINRVLAEQSSKIRATGDSFHPSGVYLLAALVKSYGRHPDFNVSHIRKGPTGDYDRSQNKKIYPRHNPPWVTGTDIFRVLLTNVNAYKIAHSFFLRRRGIHGGHVHGAATSVPKVVAFQKKTPHKQDRVDQLFTGSFNPTEINWYNPGSLESF